MIVQINSANSVHGSEEVNNKIASELESDLSRFGNRITRIEVHLSDLNGNKGGPNDKNCLLEARLSGMKPIAVSDQSHSMWQAIRGASDKLIKSLDHSLSDHSHVAKIETPDLSAPV